MSLSSDHSKKAKQVLTPLLGAALMIYFAYHAVQGDRGLLAWWQFRYQMEVSETELASVRVVRADLEHRISLLGPGSLDLDLLDEQTRRVFAYIQPNELVIIPAAQ
jgi:cell division protein FtsB